MIPVATCKYIIMHTYRWLTGDVPRWWLWN